MVTKSVHVDHSDLSIWIDSMNKIKFREFDTPEDLRDFDNSPACGIPSSVELDPNNVMAAIIDPQVFSWQSFKSAQLEKASSNTSVLATMENVIRLGFEIEEVRGNRRSGARDDEPTNPGPTSFATV